MTVLAIILAAACVFQLGLTLRSALRRNINNTAFMGQVAKLVMANQVDKAIKLCNAAPSATLTQGVKRLLVCSNRPYRLELEYQEGRLRFRTLMAVHQTIQVWGTLAFIGFGLLVLGFSATGEAPLVWVIIAGVTLTLNYFLWSHTLKNQAEGELYLLKMRNQLYERSCYTPPQHKPRAATPEEVKAWKDSLDAFEQDIRERKARGERGINSNDEHDKLAGDDGVLPPL